MWIYFLVVDVFTDVSLVRIVVSQGLSYCFLRITVEYVKLMLCPLQDGASSATQQ